MKFAPIFYYNETNRKETNYEQAAGLLGAQTAQTHGATGTISES